MRLVLIDDHAMFRDLLAESLTRRGLSVVGQASSAHAGVAVVRAQHPDIIIMDLVMCGPDGVTPGPNGISATRELRRSEPLSAVLVLTGFAQPAFASLAFRAGARGYALKTESADELVGAIEQIRCGRRYLTPSLAGKVDLDAAEAPTGLDLIDLLSGRERDTFDLVIAGRTNKEIGAELFISVKTVETHRARINRKVGAHSTGDLILLAARHGLLL